MDSEAGAGRRERYALGYGGAAHQQMTDRRATEFAEFFMPHVSRGMRILDVGSGPGSITLDLAELAAPGEVIGIDLEPLQVERARALAAQRGMANVSFEVGDAYRLPFADASFDAVFANAVLMHLRDPLEALREFRRVLRPRGVLGIHDPVTSPTWGPSTALLAQSHAMIERAIEHLVGRPAGALAFQQRRLLHSAGFGRTEAKADTISFGTTQTVRQHGNRWAALLDEAYRPTVLAQGWASVTEIDAMVAELRVWAERPDSFGCALWCAALGWVDAAEPEAGG